MGIRVLENSGACSGGDGKESHSLAGIIIVLSSHHSLVNPCPCGYIKTLSKPHSGTRALKGVNALTNCDISTTHCAFR